MTESDTDRQTERQASTVIPLPTIKHLWTSAQCADLEFAELLVSNQYVIVVRLPSSGFVQAVDIK